MSTLKQTPATYLIDKWSLSMLSNSMIYGLFGLYLGLIIVANANATGSVLAWQLSIYAILLGVILGFRLAATTFQDHEQRQAAFLSIIGVMFLILAVVYQSSSPGLGFGNNRRLALIIVFLLTVTYLLVVTDARQYTISQWGAIVCFAVLTAIYLAHTLAYHPSSPQSRWPLWAAVMMGSSLFVIPKLVPERVFLWFVSGLAAIAVVLGLGTYLIGDYLIWIFEVRQYPSSPGVPGFDPDITTIQSIFPNPNTLGLLSFAGLVAAAIEFHRSVVARRPFSASIIFIISGICGLGVFLSNARAAMLAAAVSLIIYLFYLIAGRPAVPVMITSGALGVVGLIVGMYTGSIEISASGRFELWTASLRAIRDGPLLFGHGSGPASLVLESYTPDGRSASPHNSYLKVLIQTGLVGGFAYVGLIAGSIIIGMINYRKVNVGMLVFVVGWAIHQIFESYTLFRWSMGAVLASLAIGYLLFGD